MTDRDRENEERDGAAEDAEQPSRKDFGTSEQDGLGLTAEFERIEAEIRGGVVPPSDREGERDPAPDQAERDAVAAEFGAEPPAAGGDADEGDEIRWGDGFTEASRPERPEGVDQIPEDGLEPDPEPESQPLAADGGGSGADDGGDETTVTGGGDESDGEDGESDGSEGGGDEDAETSTPAEPAADADPEGEGATDPEAETVAAASPTPTPTPESADSEPETTSERDPVSVLRGATGTGPVVRRMPRPVGQTQAHRIPEEELKIKVPSLWIRFVVGSVLIIASVAAAVSSAALLEFTDILDDLDPIPRVDEQLTAVESDKPQTILIIGSDKRPQFDKGDARSDTTMLLRIDPEKEILSLFSLPRDLKVDIPGVGVTKLNEAYTAGGATKTLRTVKQFTGLDINHIVEINFSGFADAVDAIGCVYIDVDREYFNVNDGTAANDYADIDINAGYQRLCGLKALQYVRYRHTDTDLVRAARQQDFLREARQKVKPRQLLPDVFGGDGTGNELIEIFTEYVDSDIKDVGDVIGMLKSFIAVRDAQVNEVHFEGDIGGPDNPFVTSTDEQVETAIDQFLNGVGTEGQRGGEDATKKDDDDEGSGKKKKKKKKDKKPDVPEANVLDTSAIPDSRFPTAADRFAKDAGKNARRLRIPVFYPTKLAPNSSFLEDSRTYEYNNENEDRESAYKTVIKYSAGFLPEYYGVMGTTWDDPPILRNPSYTEEIGGREYLIFNDGDRIRMVGWKQDGNSYWLNNTLSQSIGPGEMIEIARTMKEI